jgi:hypothetical protein
LKGRTPEESAYVLWENLDFLTVTSSEVQMRLLQIMVTGESVAQTLEY